MLDYKLLEALAAVVEEGGFERAAFRIGLTQSAVSQRVRLLEEQTGQILLIRSIPPQPTAAGKHFLSHLDKVRLLEKNLKLTPDADSHQEFTTIRIAINNDSLATWFTDSVENILKNEKILLDIEVDDQEQTQNLLRTGKVFCAIGTHEKPLNGCFVKKLGEMAYGMYCAAAMRKTWFADGFTVDSATRAPSLRFNKKDRINTQFYAACFHKEDLRGPTCFVPSSEQFVEWLRRGICYGAAPVNQCASLVKSGQLVDLIPERKIIVPLYFHCWNIQSPPLRQFTASLCTAAQEIFCQQDKKQ